MRTLTLVLLALLLTAVPGIAQAPAGFCGIEDLDQDTARWIEGLVKSLPRPELRLAGSVEIPVAFHVVYAGPKGRVSDQKIAALINNLNAAFSGSPFSFRLAKVDRTNNKTWYGNCLSLNNEKAMKRRLAVDPRRTLNIYTCKTSNFPVTGGVLGYAYYPFTFPENSYMHGAVIHPSLMPGGHPKVGVHGYIVAHELGHYLGLYHTFQGGCGTAGDLVADTPDEAKPTGNCAAGTDTCPAFPGLDDVTNFMNYGDDVCMNHFTPGQIQRMVEQTSAFRPSIYN